MGGAYGLQTHIWNNNFKSSLLLMGFPILLLAMTYGLFLVYAGVTGQTVYQGGGGGYYDPYGGGYQGGYQGGGYNSGYGYDEFIRPMAQVGSAAPQGVYDQGGVQGVQGNGANFSGPFLWAAQALSMAWPFALIGAGVWFVIAYFGFQAMIDASTGARRVERTQEPELYNLLENLCISRGITMPSLRIMETDAMNAFASGLHNGNYSITVTRGLMQALNRDEVEAVLGHELTHIRNRDVRLLIISVIFVGIFSFVGELMFRGLTHGLAFMGGRNSRDRSGGGAAALIAILVGVVIIGVSYALAIVIRFALSRRREYLADAGSVELTKNPDAMISALRKISTNSHVEAPSEVREMFIENPHADFAGLFATHPPIEKRIEALRKFAGGREIETPPAPPSLAEQARQPGTRGPWG